MHSHSHSEYSTSPHRWTCLSTFWPANRLDKCQSQTFTSSQRWPGLAYRLNFYVSVSKKSNCVGVGSLPLDWDSCHVQWPCCLVLLVWALWVRHFFIPCKFTLSDHLFSNYVSVPASRKLSALVMWTYSWVGNQGQCLMLETFSYPLKDEGRVNYYPPELIGFCGGWFRLLCVMVYETHTKTYLPPVKDSST